MKHSISSLALDKLLEEECQEAEAIKSRWHRTMLRRYRMALGKPDVETAAELERVSGGRVPANGWADLADSAGAA